MNHQHNGKLLKIPEKDGLPNFRVDILIWHTLDEAPSVGHYDSYENEEFWRLKYPLDAALSTDNIKFWCYTFEIK